MHKHNNKNWTVFNRCNITNVHAATTPSTTVNRKQIKLSIPSKFYTSFHFMVEDIPVRVEACTRSRVEIIRTKWCYWRIN